MSDQHEPIADCDCKDCAIAERNKLRQERNELAAMVAVMRDTARSALDWIDAVPIGTPLPAMPGFCRDDAEEALSITGPAAVHDIRAQALDEASAACNSIGDKNIEVCKGAYACAEMLESMAAAERSKGEK